MSSGHVDLDTVSLSSNAFERLLNNSKVTSRFYRPYTINREYDLPYLGGYSVDGSTIYLDRHLPDKLSYNDDGRKVFFDPDDFVPLHERWEKAVIDALGWGYTHAHEAANACERRAVVAAGLMWKPYNNALKPCLKYDEHEKLVKVPKDLDLTPYREEPVNKKLLACLQDAMGQSDGKCKKQDVDYSEGMPTSHCGPVKAWPRGECAHYIVPNGCAKVRGYIDPKYWCKLYRKEYED